MEWLRLIVFIIIVAAVLGAYVMVARVIADELSMRKTARSRRARVRAFLKKRW